MAVEDFLAQNREWAAAQVEDDPEFFRRMVKGQQPKLLWIGCSDSRVPAEQVLGCGPGELFIHRNVANIVAYNDINIASVIQYALEHLHVEDVVVCGHYNCGGIAAACADVLHHGYIGDWLLIATWAKRWVQERLAREGRSVSDEEFLRLVVEENVLLQVKHLSHLSVVRDSRETRNGLPRLHAWVYDIATGLIKVLDAGAPAPQGDE
jgi:carbonic anhydrase